MQVGVINVSIESKFRHRQLFRQLKQVNNWQALTLVFFVPHSACQARADFVRRLDAKNRQTQRRNINRARVRGQPHAVGRAGEHERHD
jgi:hypothetical protein